MKKICTKCAAEFVALGKAKTCSVECSKAAWLAYRREWSRQPKVKTAAREYARDYHQRDEVKIADRAREQKRREKPERKAWIRERKRSPEYKAYMRDYQHSPKRKAYVENYLRDYGRRPKSKEKRREYFQSPEVKERKRQYDRSPDARASKRVRSRKYYDRDKLKFLEFARELLSGKYPALVISKCKPCLLYTATCRATKQILYIGITDSWERRQRQHALSNKGATWLPAAEITIDVYPNRTLALAAEMVAIKEHRPQFNVRHNPAPQITERLAA